MEIRQDAERVGAADQERQARGRQRGACNVSEGEGAATAEPGISRHLCVCEDHRAHDTNKFEMKHDAKLLPPVQCDCSKDGTASGFKPPVILEGTKQYGR